MSDRVLLVEDEPDLGLAVKALLGRAGFAVRVAPTGRDGLRAFHTEPPDVVVLDVGLPDLDGWQVLERIREVSTRPVLMLTAECGPDSTVRGLRAGADDYLTKPFSNAELEARVRALIRRARTSPEDGPGAPALVLDDGVLRIGIEDREVSVDGRAVRLTPLEYRLICAFARHRDHVLSSGQLLSLVWDDWSALAPDRVKFAVLRLRRKLGPRVPIESVRGFGYRYRPAAEAPAPPPAP